MCVACLLLFLNHPQGVKVTSRWIAMNMGANTKVLNYRKIPLVTESRLRDFNSFLMLILFGFHWLVDLFKALQVIEVVHLEFKKRCAVGVIFVCHGLYMFKTKKVLSGGSCSYLACVQTLVYPVIYRLHLHAG